jgi:hypothetical protein
VKCDLADASSVADIRSRVALSLSVAPLQVQVMQGNIELADNTPLPMGQTLQAALKSVEPELTWHPAGKYSYNGKDVVAIRYSGSREIDWKVRFTDGTALCVDYENSPAKYPKSTA